MRRTSSERGASRVSALCAAWLAVLMLTSGCVSGSAEDSEPGDEPVNPEDNEEGGQEEGEGEQVLATSVTTSTDSGPYLQFEVYTLDHTPSDLLILEFGVTNRGSERVHFFHALSGQQESTTAHGVTLIDADNMRRYYAQEYADGACYCSNWDGQQHLAPGDTIEAWVAYPAPPEDVEAMTVEFQMAPALLDVPLGETTELREPEGDLAEPKILDIVALSDHLDEGTGRSESGDETAIMLSTDVLFDVNESVLTDEAEDILEETAAEIDAAEGELIEIDGHADNTGTDAINDPLSLDRAEAVQERLEELVTRSGVEYEAEGHGSHEPIADNDTEEGREKNRRVTVTFTP